MTPFFARICILILMKLNKDVILLINKDHGKRYFLYLHLYILKFALERQVNVESNNVQSCEFSVYGYVFNLFFVFKKSASKLTKNHGIDIVVVTY